MEITLESIVEDPYHVFVDFIKNSETLRKHDLRSGHFLKLESGKRRYAVPLLHGF